MTNEIQNESFNDSHFCRTTTTLNILFIWSKKYAHVIKNVPNDENPKGSPLAI